MSVGNVSCVVGTWAFAAEPVKKAFRCLQENKSTIDALEAGISVAENDPAYGCYLVGCGGWRNAENFLELDAALMNGDSLDFGAVTALRGFRNPIRIARTVLDKSRHSMLTGQGAGNFAKKCGFLEEKDLGKTSEVENTKTQGHDTLGLIALDSSGRISAGVSTSGMINKEAGRVGDSPLPGCGLYADSMAGSACSSGDGDHILKFSPSFKAVELMKQGLMPQEACDKVIADIHSRVGSSFEMVIIAVSNKGDIGASNLGVKVWTDPVSGKTFDGFPYAVMTSKDTAPRIECVPPLSK